MHTILLLKRLAGHELIEICFRRAENAMTVIDLGRDQMGPSCQCRNHMSPCP